MLWQLLLTALIVAACAVYALWSLLPATLRRRWQARWRDEAAPAAVAGACGGCDNCGGDALPPPRVGADGQTEAVIRFVKPLRGAAAPTSAPPRPAAPAATSPPAKPTTHKA